MAKAEACYSASEVHDLAGAVKDLGACRAELAARERFIEEQRLSAQPLAAWWQEPSMVVGGIVISAALAASVTAFVVLSTR